MNNNTKGYFNVAKKNAAKGNKSPSFAIPKLLSGRGEHATWGHYGTKTFNFVSQPSLDNKPKVGGKGKRTQSEIEQDQIKVATAEVVTKIENERKMI